MLTIGKLVMNIPYQPVPKYDIEWAITLLDKVGVLTILYKMLILAKIKLLFGNGIT